jgi:hypothetical protein
MLGVYDLPILSTVPRSGTWFLRYAIAFLCHLEQGGHIRDRLTGRVYGAQPSPDFDFVRFRGGPLFHVEGTLPAKHLFVGHTVCPGFAGRADNADWWTKTSFHVPGYDYLHDGLNYRYTPVDLATYRYTPLHVRALERTVAKGRGQPAVLVYRNPLDQAASYFRYCQNHKDAAYNSINGRPLARVPFRDYLFECALPSYAKQFMSFQALATLHPRQVRLVPYERMMEDPIDVLAEILDHLFGRPQEWPALEIAVRLARRDHLKAIEKELDRSLDGTRVNRGSHISQVIAGKSDWRVDDKTRSDALALLRQWGIDTDLFVWPADPRAASAA